MMAERIPRFEIVRSLDGYHVRFWSGTRIVWWTETYKRLSGAHRAITLITGMPVRPPAVPARLPFVVLAFYGAVDIELTDIRQEQADEADAMDDELGAPV